MEVRINLDPFMPTRIGYFWGWDRMKNLLGKNSKRLMTFIWFWARFDNLLGTYLHRYTTFILDIYPNPATFNLSQGVLVWLEN